MIISFALLLVLLSSCQFGAYEKKINNNYTLSAIDTKDDMELIYVDDEGLMFSIISATVFSIGKNDEYIVAKQHPKDFPNQSNKNITNYFIVPLKFEKVKDIEKNKIGPLTAIEFDYIKKQLNLEKIVFDITID